MTIHADDARLWADLSRRAAAEFAALPEGERAWIAEQLTRAEGLQDALHALFLAVDGAATCAACVERCCDHGKYHLTLVNLLCYQARGETFPVPDFSGSCPMLATDGCRLPPGRRPFNCVTFICGAVEEGLDAVERERFWTIESGLRQIYASFDRRYAGSSLRGLLNRGVRLGPAALFGPAVPGL
jgi:hypothetical protein